MLGRVKNLAFTLRLLVLPVSSKHSMPDRFNNPVLALELFKRCKSKTYVIVAYIAYFVCAALSFDSYIRSTNIIGFWDCQLPGPCISPYADFLYISQFDDLLWRNTFQVVGVIFLVVPALAAGSVVGERRRGTLMPVQLSLLRPFDIVWGKVAASVAPVLFPAGVCVVTLVLFSLKAGVLDNMVDIGTVYRLFGSVVAGVALVVLSMAVSVVCVLFSTFAKSSATAIAMSYGLFSPMMFIVLFTASLLNLVYGTKAEITVGLSLLVGGIVGLPLCFLWACRRLRLPAVKVHV